MKPFEEMTKAEKMKVLEEDYLERKKQEEEKLQRREARIDKLKTIWTAILFTVMMCLVIYTIGLFVWKAIVDVENRTEAIIGAVFYAMMTVAILYGLIYHSLKS